MEEMNFGQYLTQLRLSREWTLRKFAFALELSPVYICDVEKSRKPAPSDERLKQIIDLLKLTREETEKLYDLSANSRTKNAIANDLPEYINANNIVRVALRTAKNVGATDREWEEFIEKLNYRANTEEEKNE